MVDESYERAKKRAHDIRDFYNHFIIYIIVNAMLIIINFLTSPGAWWFYWISIFWGIGLVWHAFSVFVQKGIFSKEWEDKKIKEIIEKEKKD